MAKTLILFYSRSENTRTAAKFIADEVQGDLFQVETVVPYASEYKDCVQQAVAEWKGNTRPEVKAVPENVEQYENVVVAFPNWCGTMPMCLYTVLEKLDLSGKKVYALCTHGGSGFAQSVENLAKLCPGAEVSEGLAVKGVDVTASEAMIRSWARENL